MRRDLVTSLIAVVALTLLFGVAYPLLVTGAAQVAFHGRADGSKITRNGRVVGSRLIGQDFRVQATGANGKPLNDKDGNPVMKPVPRYFQERPSTATSYAADATAFTNLGPNSKDARDTFKSNLAAYLQLERPYDPGLTAARCRSTRSRARRRGSTRTSRRPTRGSRRGASPPSGTCRWPRSTG